VEPDRPAKSSGSENTFSQDLVALDRIQEEVAAMARDAAAWLERHELYARTVTIKVRYSDFTTITRSHSSLPATRDAEDLVRRSFDLLTRTEAGRRPVRLLGVSVHNFSDVPGEPLPLRRLRPLPLFDE
jgi:DNA polymerase IV